MDLKADLRDFWTYNTKQMFVYLEMEYWSGENQLNQISFYDAILRQKKLVKLNRSIRQEYPIVSQNQQLRGTPLNVTLNWSIMPKVGVESHLLLSSIMLTVGGQLACKPEVIVSFRSFLKFNHAAFPRQICWILEYCKPQDNRFEILFILLCAHRLTHS